MLKLVRKAVIILDVPTPDHIDSLVSAFDTPAYSPFRMKQPASRKDCAVHVIYHFLGSNVLEDERYKSLMNGFSDETHHLISSPDHNSNPLTFTSAGLSQLRLNQLDPEMFPLLHYSTDSRKGFSCAFAFVSHSHVSLNQIHCVSSHPAPTPEFISATQQSYRYPPAKTCYNRSYFKREGQVSPRDGCGDATRAFTSYKRGIYESETYCKYSSGKAGWWRAKCWGRTRGDSARD